MLIGASRRSRRRLARDELEQVDPRWAEIERTLDRVEQRLAKMASGNSCKGCGKPMRSFCSNCADIP